MILAVLPTKLCKRVKLRGGRRSCYVKTVIASCGRHRFNMHVCGNGSRVNTPGGSLSRRQATVPRVHFVGANAGLPSAGSNCLPSLTPEWCKLYVDPLHT